MPDSLPIPSADQDMDTKGESTESVDLSSKEDKSVDNERLSDPEEQSETREPEEAAQQSEVEPVENRPSVSDNGHASDSAASTPFGTPENKDHPLPEVSGDGRPEESPDILDNLRSSPTPRTINLPNIAITSPHGPSNSIIAASRLATYGHEPDSPTSNLVSSLKAQLEALSEQRDMLNQKLVTSFSRMADLEDDLFQIRDTTDAQKRQIDELERERKEHLHALDTGLLVEQSNVKQEMQRLAASLMDEQGKRDLAEEGKQKVESEVDDLAASLFQQANSMVAAERLARSRAETRLVAAEENLSVAENVVREMQSAMQALSLSSEASQTKTNLGSAKPHPIFRNDHIPYAEFLAFVTHLRSMRPRNRSSAPPFSSLLQFVNMAFFARVITEDHEPALRLDFAPGVSWLNKKSISQAVIDSMLIVEPVSAAQVFSQKPEGDIVCALSGELISPASANPLLQNAEPNSTSSAAPPQTRAPAVSQSPSEKSTSLYPVAEGWSLDRLRATCELWRFVKTGIMNPVWSYDDGTTPAGPPKLPARSEHVSQTQPTPDKAAEPVKPALPARKSNSWGLNLGFGKSSGPSSGGWGLSKSQPGTPKDENSNKALTVAPNLPARKLPPPLTSAKVQDRADEETTVSVHPTQPDQSLSDEPASSSFMGTEAVTQESLPVEPIAESTSQESEIQAESSETQLEETPAAPSENELAHNEEPAEIVELPSVNAEEASVDPIGASPKGVDYTPAADILASEKEVEGSASARTSLEQTGSNRASLEQPSSKQPSAVATGPAPPLPKRAAARRAVPPVPTSTAVSEAGTRPATPVPALVDEPREASPIKTTLSIPTISDGPSEVSDLSAVSDVPNQPSDVSLSDADPVSASPVLALPEEKATEHKEQGATTDIAAPSPSLDETEKKVEVEESAPVKEDSWEEKTWKELVRLREDLFWKRIGVRPSGV
ncbi:Guanine nucleotide exchange factor [Phaffia rhodozyma]|uniref:Guanine nucleotide exchange factor n=1 Tax=Phaffia rhodozyma TaxID=264483 RepID=A0A0F7SHV9_PHARH|nr:Guanine nucleotide exchange factor [Phaffia rhodozyma]